jgi:hypothetical protein
MTFTKLNDNSRDALIAIQSDKVIEKEGEEGEDKRRRRRSFILSQIA